MLLSGLGYWGCWGVNPVRFWETEEHAGAVLGGLVERVGG